MSKSYRVIFILFVMLFFPIITIASIKGTVYSKGNNSPLMGATITLPEQNISVQTDFEGRFFIPNSLQGTYLINIKALGHDEFNGVVTTCSGVDYNIGKISLATTYNRLFYRLSLSYNPTCSPTPTGYKMVEYALNYGVSAKFQLGYNFYKHFAILAGIKYNYTWGNENCNDGTNATLTQQYAGILANLAYLIPVKNVVIEPYIGLHVNYYIQSKVDFKNSEGNATLDYLSINNKRLYPGYHAGLGLTFNRFYLGGEFGMDFERNYQETSPPTLSHQTHSTSPVKLDKFEYSVSIGYEF